MRQCYAALELDAMGTIAFFTGPYIRHESDVHSEGLFQVSMSLIQLENASEPTLLPMPIELQSELPKWFGAMHQEELVEHGLQVGVTGGGCSGLQYLLDFARNPAKSTSPTNSTACAYSSTHTRPLTFTGTKIDYVDNLQGSGFKFDQPNIVRSCGMWFIVLD